MPSHRSSGPDRPEGPCSGRGDGFSIRTSTGTGWPAGHSRRQAFGKLDQSGKDYRRRHSESDCMVTRHGSGGEGCRERVAEREQIEALFGSLAVNRVDEFLAGCAEQLLITLWGSSPMSSTVSRDQLSSWWQGFDRLTEGTLVTELLLTVPDERSYMVILRHRFTRGERCCRFDTVNICTLRDGVLVAWFSSPLDRQEYARAWGLQSPRERPARIATGHRRTAPMIPLDLEGL